MRSLDKNIGKSKKAEGHPKFRHLVSKQEPGEETEKAESGMQEESLKNILQANHERVAERRQAHTWPDAPKVKEEED